MLNILINTMLYAKEKYDKGMSKIVSTILKHIVD